jgi:hypothetical protein
MFINYESTPISISITAYEDVDVFEMQTEGATEEQVETHPLDGESSATWDLIVPAGGIWGLGAYHGVTYDDPDHEVTILMTDDNPWPTPPPPPPPLFQDVRDFQVRYEDFLTAVASAQVAA